MGWNASLEGKMQQKIEKAALTTINSFLPDLQIVMEKMILGQFQSLVDSRLPDTELFVSTA